jgi:hypothetical protein
LSSKHSNIQNKSLDVYDSTIANVAINLFEIFVFNYFTLFKKKLEISFMTRNYSIIVYVLVLFTLIEIQILYAFPLIQSEEPSSQTQPIPKGVSVYQLDNGMTMLVRMSW